MSSRDLLQRFVFENTPVRGELIRLDATWRAVLARHDYPVPLRDVLGELMAAAALLSATIKLAGSLILQVQGSGCVKLIVVECTSAHTLRATAKWSGQVAAQPLRDMVGDARLVITIDPSGGRERYQGIVSLQGESVAAALEDYLTRSEQLDSRLWLAADGRQATGMLLQKLPNAPSRDGDAWNRAVSLGETLRRDELLELPALEIIHRLYHEEDVRLFEGERYSFRCSCTRERVARVLRMMGRKEIQDLLRERGGVQVNCEFCNQSFRFDAVDVAQVFTPGVVASGSTIQH